MNFSVTNNRLKLNNGYDVSGSINTSSLLVGTSAGINPTNTLDVSGTANITGNFIVDTNTFFVDASNNRVGVGTTTPNYKLHVEGSGTANEVVGWFNNQGAFSSSIAVRQAAKTAYITNHNGLGTPNYDGQLSNAISYGVSSGASPIQFWNGNTGVGSRGTAKMTILENGNVGIGTTTPSYPLDVSGSAKITTIRDISNNVGSSGQVLSSTGSGLVWIPPPVPSISTGYAVLREIQPAGTNSTVSFPNTTSNVRTLREINNIQFDNLGITISGSPNWTITIPTAGTYAFSGRAMFNITKVGGTPYTIAVNSKVFISDGTNENFIVGDSMTWNLGTSGTDTFNVNVDLTAVASITGSTTISFKQVCNPVFTGATQALTGGRAVNILSAPEVYATLQITKLS